MEVLGAAGTLGGGGADPAWGVREGCLEEVVLMLSLQEEQESEGSPQQRGRAGAEGGWMAGPQRGPGKDAGVHPQAQDKESPKKCHMGSWRGPGALEGSRHRNGRARL